MFLYFSNLYFKQVIFCSKNIILKGKGHLCFDIDANDTQASSDEQSPMELTQTEEIDSTDEAHTIGQTEKSETLSANPSTHSGLSVGNEADYALNSTNVTVIASKIPTEIIIANATMDLTVLKFTSAGATLNPSKAGVWI